MNELRREDLADLWNNETDEAWREDLCPEERRFVRDLDRRYRRGVLRMCEDILIREKIRELYDPFEIAELRSMRGYCLLRLKNGELYNAYLSEERELVLAEVDPVC